jgi:hypothetical protein
MPASISLDDLRPFKSVLVARISDGEETTARKILLKLRKVLDVKTNAKSRRVIAVGNESDPVEISFVHYDERRAVAWSRELVVDHINHLALVIRKDAWIAIHITETSRKRSVTKALRKGELGPLALAAPGQLKAAFVKGRARTLWLRGTHHSTDTKPDTKVMGGRDLETALDPLADQSYRYTAIRAEPDNAAIGDVMGLAVDESRLWIAPSSDRADFEATISAVLKVLGESEGSSLEPLPVLATAQTDLAGVNDAYEVAITPPELMVAGPVLDSQAAQELAELEKLAFATSFEVSEVDGTSLKARVRRRGDLLGEIEIDFSDAPEGIQTSLFGAAELGRFDEFSEVMTQLRDPESMTVSFESGHSVQGGQVFSMRHRDLPFTGWRWVDLDSVWEVHREKPQAGLSAIGTGDHSLFSWVQTKWPTGAKIEGSSGWLACDDRPGETADFLHLDLAPIPTLTLIHVKGASSSSSNREIAVAPYEVVCGQAVKNLRHLDRQLAAGNLMGTSLPEGLDLLAWEEGETRDRELFVERLNALDASVRRRVVIVQPHVRESLIKAVRENPDHAQLPRLRRLDWLLNGTAANCAAVGAELIVIGAA